ncbi:MAG: single-stranded-DNA-specific exonuclease RecJ [Oscillospiraceae bacterium]|nr:single-stranded-DNA-specific exonuclease RecJ [Oscillospiraceae bacterium]
MKARAFEGWWVGQYSETDAATLRGAGYPRLLASLLCSRGLVNPYIVREFMREDIEMLHDPFLMKDMDKAVLRIRRAVAAGEKVAVYGDYDVDGLTSTALMTDYIRSLGLSCRAYIPERLTEGYGMSEEALKQICASGVTLIITVDCGITSFEQIRAARRMGMDVIVTDHHECLGPLPEACAVVDPRRLDCPYPFKGLAGVGVAFKLVCASEGPENTAGIIARYGELAAMGTIADVMPVVDENRAIIRRGIEVLHGAGRLGLNRLLNELGLVREKVSGSDISFSVVPKLNAAGRMGHVRTAFELLMSEDEREADALAKSLCDMNNERREVENRVYSEALEQLGKSGRVSSPIVLASDNWHHGVSGIVASRLAERFGVPAVVICLDGDSGRGSCRSFGNFNIFMALNYCRTPLTSFGGHALAAGLTLQRDAIDEFRGKLTEYYNFTEGDFFQMKLPVDFCVDDPSMLTLRDIEGLKAMEPWGSGNPPPSLCLRNMNVESVTPIGGDRHVKLRVSRDGRSFECVFFSVSAKELGVHAGATVDLAFEPGINEFRGTRSVQLLLKDVRASRCGDEPTLELARRFFAGAAMLPVENALLLPERGEFAKVWNNIIQRSRRFLEPLDELLPDIALHTGISSLGRIYVCLRVFDELGLINLREFEENMDIHIPRIEKKADLNASLILQKLR